jgi:FkbM family methyltransferase
LDSGLVVRISSPGQWILFTDIFVRGEYDPAIDAAIERADNSFLAVDLGANVGFFTLRLADRVLRAPGLSNAFTIYSVEGAFEEYTELERRLDQPPLRGHCRPMHALAGNRGGQGVITRGREHTNNVVAIGKAGDEVPYVDLEALLPADRPIDLLKCDIEGSEVAFLDSYRDLLERVRVAVFELHGDRCDTTKCEQVLSAAGFKNRRVTTEGINYVVGFTR